MEFRSLHTLTTAENVPVRVELAGLANRVFAFGLDMIGMLTLMGCFLLVLLASSGFKQFSEVQKTIAPLGFFIIFFGYHLFQEWLWNGQSIGKRILGIRVVRQNGQPIGFWEALGRNLLRVVDVYVAGIGLVCMMFNANEKRLGDFLAGTLVIQNQVVARPIYRMEAQLPENPVAEEDSMAARMLTPEEAEWINSFLIKRNHLLKTERTALLADACSYFTNRFHQAIEQEADLEMLLVQHRKL
jgi:uncharacterized RDD family membrane protein YckC